MLCMVREILKFQIHISKKQIHILEILDSCHDFSENLEITDSQLIISD